MSNTANVKKQLLQMSPDQLKGVRKFATMLIGNKTTKTTASPVKEAQDDDMHRIVLDIICALMQARGHDFSTPGMLRETPSYKAFKGKLDEELMNYARNVTKRNRIALRAFLYVAFDLLLRNLVKLKLPISSRTMMAHLHRIPAIIDASFPGYASSGMLHLVIRKDERPKRKHHVWKK